MRPFPLVLDRMIDWLGVLALTTSGLSMVAMMTLGAVDAVTTAFFDKPIPSANEVAAACLAAVIFGALPMTQRLNKNVVVDVVVSVFPRRLRVWLAIISLVCGALFFALLGNEMISVAAKSWAIGEYAAGAVPVPIYPFKLFVTFSVVVTALEFLRQAVRAVLRRNAGVGEIEDSAGA